MISNETIFFISFCLFILGVLFFDLKFVGRKSHVVSFKESIKWTAVWVSFALIFFLVVRFFGDKIHSIQTPDQLLAIKDKFAAHLIFTGDFAKDLIIYKNNLATEFLTGYLIEYSLSIDNIFVIMMILSGFSVQEKYYKKVLFWGILGAIVLRFLFIFIGSALIQQFEWILYVFGGFLIYSGIKMFITRNKEEKIEPHEHVLVKYLSKRFPVYPHYVDGKFFHKEGLKRFLTPLFIVVIVVEFTDLIFALDSIPAIFSVTRDPYIVFFSNIFAIIGLRSLFFLLSKLVNYFRFLKIGISFLLTYIGIKLLAHHFLDKIGFETVYSLYIILATLILSIVLSVLIKPNESTIKKNKVI